MTRSVATLPAPAAVAFDLDGTLVDTVPARIAAWVQALREERISVSEASVAALIGSDGKYVAHESARAVGLYLTEDRAGGIDRRQGEIFDALNTDPKPLPASRALLGTLDARGIPWAIATSSRHEQVGASVKVLELPRPPTIIDGSDVANAKPAPDLLLKASRVLGVQPNHCWYVGDSTWDMRAARAAAMIAIGVTAGSAVRGDDLRAAGATIVCKTLRRVRKLVGQSSPDSNPC
ncbi:MAG: HAD family phosphatase [Methanobacteriota archaeon]|nr:MAG: HAD family phosphatase [Euryarchaeota archaeon]